MDMARLHPKINYVGIEMYDSVLLRPPENGRAGENGTALNLRFMRIDAQCCQIFLRRERWGRLSQFFRSLAKAAMPNAV